MGAPNSRANSDIPFHLDLYMRHNSKNNQIPPIWLTSEKGPYGWTFINQSSF